MPANSGPLSSLGTYGVKTRLLRRRERETPRKEKGCNWHVSAALGYLALVMRRILPAGTLATVTLMCPSCGCTHTRLGSPVITQQQHLLGPLSGPASSLPCLQPKVPRLATPRAVRRPLACRPRYPVGLLDDVEAASAFSRLRLAKRESPDAVVHGGLRRRPKGPRLNRSLRSRLGALASCSPESNAYPPLTRRHWTTEKPKKDSTLWSLQLCQFGAGAA